MSEYEEKMYEQMEDEGVDVDQALRDADEFLEGEQEEMSLREKRGE